jgi:hypothetical protein
MSDGTKDSAGLRKVLGKEAFKCIAVQARCMENLEYTSWEPSLQYKFPQKTYAELLSSLQRFQLPLRNEYIDGVVYSNCSLSKTMQPLAYLDTGFRQYRCLLEQNFFNHNRASLSLSSIFYRVHWRLTRHFRHSYGPRKRCHFVFWFRRRCRRSFRWDMSRKTDMQCSRHWRLV